MKKIAIVANSGWNIWNFRRHLIRELINKGYQPLILAPKDGYVRQLQATFPDIPIHPLRHLSAGGTNPVQDLLLLLELWQLYRRHRPLLVLHFTIKPNIYGGLAARFSGTPYLATITGLGYAFLNGGWVQQLVRWLYRIALKKARFVVFQNRDDAGLFEKMKLVRSGQSYLIPGSGVDGKHFVFTPLPVFPPFRYLFVGRLLSDKGIREFVGAARSLAQSLERVEFWVAGSAGSNNPAAIGEEVLGKWRKLPRMRWLGEVDDIRSVIEQAHVLVLPSYREGMPRAVLEAMAMGRPIITTDTAGCRDTVIPGENGLVVSVRNTADLVRAMLELYGTPAEKLEEMGRMSRQLVEERFEAGKINKMYLELIRKID